MKPPKLSQNATKSVLIRVAAVLVSFLIGSILIMTVGVDPIEAYQVFLYGAFGSRVNLANTLSVATPLMLAGLGIAFAARGSAFNIGAEGQLYIGAIFATWVGLRLGNLPATLLIPAILTAGFVGGGMWGAVPGFLKAKYGINEIVLTVMLTEIAIQIVSWVIRGPMLDPHSFGIPQSAALSEFGRLPLLLSGTRLHTGLLVGLAAGVILYFLLFKTTFGFRVRAVGHNPRAAGYAGMKVASTITLSMLISGGLAGIAGAIEVAGVHYRLMDDISPGYGWTAIVVSLLGKRHPLGVVVSAILFAALMGGTDAMQRRVAVPVHLAQIIQAMTILFVIIGDYLSTYGVSDIGERLTRLFRRLAGSSLQPTES